MIVGAGGPGLWTPPERLSGRRGALAARLAAEGFDAALVFGHGSALGAAARSHAGLRFLADFDGHEAWALLVLPDLRAPDAFWLCPQSIFVLPLAERAPSARTPQIVPAQAPAFVIETLAPARRIALIGFDEAPYALARALAPLLERASAADAQLDALRLVKDADALARHREGAAICDALFGAVGPRLGAAARDRRPLWRVQIDLEAMARALGAEDVRTWFSVAPVPDFPRYWREELGRVPEEGDQALFGVALRVGGCWAHGLRTAAIGRPPAELLALARDVETIMAAGLAALQPGAPLSAARDAMDAACAALSPAPDVAWFRFAHGLGYSYEEPGVSSLFAQKIGPPEPPERAAEQLSARVAPGMVFELHPNLFAPGRGAAALGEMVVVTAGGPVRLTTAPRDVRGF